MENKDTERNDPKFTVMFQGEVMEFSSAEEAASWLMENCTVQH